MNLGFHGMYELKSMVKRIKISHAPWERRLFIFYLSVHVEFQVEETNSITCHQSIGVKIQQIVPYGQI